MSDKNTYTAKLSHDLMVISRQEYNGYIGLQMENANLRGENINLQGEIMMLREQHRNLLKLHCKMMEYYSSVGVGQAELRNSDDISTQSDNSRRIPSPTKAKKLQNKGKGVRRDSGVDVIVHEQESEDENDDDDNSSENLGQQSIGTGRPHATIGRGDYNVRKPYQSTNVGAVGHQSLDLVEEDDTSASGLDKGYKSRSTSIGVRSSGSENGVTNPNMGAFPPTGPQRLMRNHATTMSSNRPPDIPNAPPATANATNPTIPSSQFPAFPKISEKKADDVKTEPEKESWEIPEPKTEVTFDLDDSWRENSDWNYAGGSKPPVAFTSSAPTSTRPVNIWSSLLGQPKMAKNDFASTIQSPVMVPEIRGYPAVDSAAMDPGPPRAVYQTPHKRAGSLIEIQESPPLPPTSSRKARDLFLEKQARATRAQQEEKVELPQELTDPTDISTFRHIFIPNLPANTRLSTITSLIRTNGKGIIESISMFRQRPLNSDSMLFDLPGTGEDIGCNITFYTAAACHEWFTHLYNSASPKHQTNAEKTFIFPTEDCAADWKKCVILRRAEYHPSIAGKLEKGGPGGSLEIADAVKTKGLRRTLYATGLPAEVTETELARLVLPPGNRSLTYEGPSHRASGQAILTTEEFARWKWIEKIIIEDDMTAPIGGFGDGYDQGRKKTAKIYLAGIKTAFLARKKLWHKFNEKGKKRWAGVNVGFCPDECEGPLSEIPAWVAVNGDDADSMDDVAGNSSW